MGWGFGMLCQVRSPEKKKQVTSEKIICRRCFCSRRGGIHPARSLFSMVTFLGAMNRAPTKTVFQRLQHHFPFNFYQRGEKNILREGAGLRYKDTVEGFSRQRS